MDGLSDKLKLLLSDPQAIERIAAVAKTLNVSTPSDDGSKQETVVNDVPAGAFSAFGKENGNSSKEPDEKSGEDNGDSLKKGIAGLLNMPELKLIFGKGCRERNELLCALKPFVSKEKREKLDGVVKTMKTLETLYSAKDLLL